MVLHHHQSGIRKGGVSPLSGRWNLCILRMLQHGTHDLQGMCQLASLQLIANAKLASPASAGPAQQSHVLQLFCMRCMYINADSSALPTNCKEIKSFPRAARPLLLAW